MTVDLLLLPGLNNTGAVFDAVVAALPEGVRTHAPDLPPLANVDALADWVLAGAPPRFWLAGFSFGGYVALAVLAAAPERVLGLSLVCALADADSAAQTSRRQALIADARAGRHAANALATTAVFHPDSLGRPALMARRAALVHQYGAERAIAHLAACIARPGRSHLLDGRHPCLFVTASHDSVVPPDAVRALAAQVPGSRLAVIAGAGHMLPLERPDDLADALAGWMSSTNPAA